MAKIKKQGPSMGMWTMLNNVLIASINKGQFPVVILGLIVLVIVLRLPPSALVELVTRIFDGLEHRWLLGYLIGLVTSFGWFFHSRYQRRIITTEMSRIGRERTQAQEKLLKQKLTSSEDKK